MEDTTVHTQAEDTGAMSSTTNTFVEALLQETEKELDRATTQFSFPVPGQGAKSDVLFNSIGVFAHKGITETTVQDLLDAANISRRTFYKYFKNKVDVLESIYRMAAELLTTRFRVEMAQTQSLSDFVVRCVDMYFDYHINLGPLVRMMTEEARRSDSPLASHREALIHEIVELFQDKYSQMEGSRLDPQVFYAIIWSMESASIHVLTETSCSAEEVNRWKCIMRSLAARALVSDPDLRPDLPLEPQG
ncbi:MAG: TetR/AcrR family transcriptional regulator [Ketobacteraceae bacterium]|nr:TetR/AcrR family transcriptional regulator [Ketobacteraceae bacterium]